MARTTWSNASASTPPAACSRQAPPSELKASTAWPQWPGSPSSRPRHHCGMSGMPMKGPGAGGASPSEGCVTGDPCASHPAPTAWRAASRKTGVRASKPGAPWSKRACRDCPCASTHGVRRVAMRPPGPRDLSKTCTDRPASVNLRAQVAPDRPAPTTATRGPAIELFMAQSIRALPGAGAASGLWPSCRQTPRALPARCGLPAEEEGAGGGVNAYSGRRSGQGAEEEGAT